MKFDFEKSWKAGPWLDVPPITQYHGYGYGIYNWAYQAAEQGYEWKYLEEGRKQHYGGMDFYGTVGTLPSSSGWGNTPALPTDATTSLQQSAINEAISECLSGATRTNADINYWDYGQTLLINCDDVWGSPGWPFNHRRPYQYYYSAHMEQEFRYVKPNLTLPQPSPWPEHAIGYEWESDEWTIERIDLQWMMVGFTDADQLATLTATSSVRVTTDAATMKDIEQSIIDYDSGRGTAHTYPAGKFPIVLESITVTSPNGTGRIEKVQGGSMSLSGAGTYKGMIGIQRLTESASIQLPPDGSFEHGLWGHGGWDSDAYAGIYYTDSNRSGLLATYTMRMPRLRFIYDEGAGGDGVKPLSLKTSISGAPTASRQTFWNA